MSRSRLQEIFLFWFPGRKIPARDSELRAMISSALGGRDGVYERFVRLTESQQNMLFTVAELPEYAGAMSEILSLAPASRIPRYELDSVMRTLSTSGLLSSAPAREWGLAGGEVYYVPKEPADMIRSFRQLGDTPAAELSLARYLRKMPAEERARTVKKFLRADAGADPAELAEKLAAPSLVRKRIERLSEPGLRKAVEDAIISKGGIVFVQHNGEILPVAEDHTLKVSWRRAMEDNLVGTVGRLDLRVHGIELEAEALVVFAEAARELLLAYTVDSSRIEDLKTAECDIIVELDNVLNYIRSRRLALSSDKQFYREDTRAMFERSFLLGKVDMTEQELAAFLVGLLEAVGVVDVHDEVLITAEAEKWAAKSIGEKIRALVEVVRLEKNSRGSDFHQRQLRRIAIEYLSRLEPGKWYHPKALVNLATSNYVSNLDELNIGDKFKSYKFRKQSKPFSLRNRYRDIREDLFWWIRYRLFALGMVEFGMRGEEYAAMRLSSLGARVLGHAQWGENAGKVIIVNPDYEILLFPEGNYYKIYTEIASFAVREKQDRITHFRINAESVKRAIMGGFEPKRVVELLERHSKTPIPQNVKFSILDWEKTVSRITISKPVLLEAEDEGTLKRVLSIAELARLVERDVSPKAVVLKEKPAAKKIAKELKNLGVYLK
jgi:hypothetical protein